MFTRKSILYGSMDQQYSTGHRSTLPPHNNYQQSTLPPAACLSSTLLVTALPHRHTVFTSKNVPPYRSKAQQYSTGNRSTLLSHSIYQKKHPLYRSMGQQYSTGHRSSLPPHNNYQWSSLSTVAWLSSTLLVTAVPYCHTVFPSKNVPSYRSMAQKCWQPEYPTVTQYLPLKVPSLPQHGSAVFYWSPQYPTVTQYLPVKVPSLPQHGSAVLC